MVDYEVKLGHSKGTDDKVTVSLSYDTVNEHFEDGIKNNIKNIVEVTIETCLQSDREFFDGYTFDSLVYDMCDLVEDDGYPYYSALYDAVDEVCTDAVDSLSLEDLVKPYQRYLLNTRIDLIDDMRRYVSIELQRNQTHYEQLIWG